MTLANSFKQIMTAKQRSGRTVEEDSTDVEELEECATAFEVAGLGLGLDDVNFSSDEA